MTERRTALGVARQFKALVDDHFLDAVKVRVVLDNLNVHEASVLYQAFPPGEARRIAQRLELHYTSKHGSWLNMAEMEFSVLDRQCLDRRLGARETVANEVATWEKERNAREATVNWRFDTSSARTRLARLYSGLPQ